MPTTGKPHAKHIKTDTTRPGTRGKPTQQPPRTQPEDHLPATQNPPAPATPNLACLRSRPLECRSEPVSTGPGLPLDGVQTLAPTWTSAHKGRSVCPSREFAGRGTRTRRTGDSRTGKPSPRP